MPKVFLVLPLLAVFTLVISCGNNTSSNTTTTTPPPANTPKGESSGKKGVEYAIKEVSLSNPLDADMIAEGQTISELKCTSCHSLEENRLVGPGWKGITTRRKPEWIMNMITNVEMMLAEDEEAQKMLEECLVRMPNQNIKVSEARAILEFMRKNDGEE